MDRNERLKHIQEHPEEHKHSFEDLTACCMVGNAFDPLLMEAHPELGRNGGQKCDVVDGPCSCGAWH